MNHPQTFQKSIVFEPGVSKFHKQLTVTVVKQYFPKQKSKAT